MKKWGIDISTWQGDYDLKRAKDEGVEFVIIKGAGGDDGLYKDRRFEENYSKAKALGLPVGAYFFSYAKNTVEAEREALFFYNNCLRGKQFELPIYMDVENRAQLAIGKRALTDVIKTFCSTLEAKGYFVGIYSSESYFYSYMYDEELKRYCHWVANWSRSCGYDCGLWQFGGSENAIRTNIVAGQVTDQDYLYEDYPKIIKEGGFNGYGSTPTPEPTPTPPTPPGKLDEDGDGGPATITALQKFLGTPQDGVISGQYWRYRGYYPNIIAVTYNEGGSLCVEKLQEYLTRQGYPTNIDGGLGPSTIIALQSFLNAKIGAGLSLDGVAGPATVKALQRWLNTV